MDDCNEPQTTTTTHRDDLQNSFRPRAERSLNAKSKACAFYARTSALPPPRTLSGIYRGTQKTHIQNTLQGVVAEVVRVERLYATIA